MVNPFSEVNWNPGSAEKRKFAISLLIGFPCLGFAFFLIRRLAAGEWDASFPLALAAAGVAVGLILLVVPALARPIYIGWYFMACCIGFIVANVLLSLFFFVAVTGVGVLLRIAGKSPIRKGLDRGAKSYWIEVKTVADARRYLSQF